jgi:DNA-binding NtrC family response regulator
MIKRYLVLGDERAIIDELDSLRSSAMFASSAEDPGSNASLKHLVRNLRGNAESAAIAQSLDGTGWNRKVAASNLQISYKALLCKIKQYNLRPPRKGPVSIGQANRLDRAQPA